VDVPRSLDLRQHDHIELRADRANDLHDVIERPGRIEGVDAHPQASRAEIVLPGHFNETATRRFLLVRRDGVLEVTKQHVHASDNLVKARANLWILRRYEVDHALEAHGKLAKGLRRADGKRAIELGGRTGGGHDNSCSRNSA